MTSTENRFGVIGQLERMLNNHNTRKKHDVEVVLRNRNNEELEKENICIYSDKVEYDINKKVRKMKIEGGICSLRIVELFKKDDNDYFLALIV